MDATLCGLMSSFPAVPDIAKNLPLGALPLTKVYAISGASIFIVLLSESVSVQLLYSPHDFWTRAVVSGTRSTHAYACNRWPGAFACATGVVGFRPN
jgi:hypothetical protein